MVDERPSDCAGQVIGGPRRAVCQPPRAARWLAIGGLLLAIGGLLLAGCGQPLAPDPLADVRRWAPTVTRYRYERVTVIVGAAGQTSTIRESGEVIRPDRQQVVIRARAGDGREERHDLIVVGQRAWVRPAVVGQAWRLAEPGSRPADPLTIALGTLAAAGPVRLQEERIEGGRRCQGFAYTVELHRVPDWPLAGLAASTTAEALLWRDEGGAICGQLVRLQRADQLVAEYSVTLRDFDVPLRIEPPSGGAP